MLIGARFASGVWGFRAGAVYVLERTPAGWTETAKFFASDGFWGQRFGSSVALVGGRALVGAPEDDDNGPEAGAAYVFELVAGTWVQATKLLASDGADGNMFGLSVGLDGDVALVGAQGAQSAYFFERLPTGWVETQKVVPSNASVAFGRSVAIQGGRALVGAPLGDSPLLTYHGVAYVFELTPSGWTETDVLFDPAGPAMTFLGQSVALDGDTAVIGAPFGDGVTQDWGVAHVFTDTPSGWTQQAKLFSPPAMFAGPTGFGSSISLQGDSVVAGASGDDEAGPHGAGAAYYFERTGVVWTELAKFLPESPQQDASFGSAVSVDGQRAVVGALNHGVLHPAGTHLVRVGGAVAFDLACPISSSYCTPGLPNSTGQPAALRATGSPAVASNFVRLTAGGLPPDQFGYFLVSRTQGFVNPPGSTGFLCLGGDIGRYDCSSCGQVQSSGATGSMSIGRGEGLDLNNLPLNVPPVFTSPGDTLNFQCWYRDFNPTLTSNFTDGVSILFN